MKIVTRKIVVTVDGVPGWAVDRELGPLEDADRVAEAEMEAAKWEWPQRRIMVTLLVDEAST